MIAYLNSSAADCFSDEGPLEEPKKLTEAHNPLGDYTHLGPHVKGQISHNYTRTTAKKHIFTLFQVPKLHINIKTSVKVQQNELFFYVSYPPLEEFIELTRALDDRFGYTGAGPRRIARLPTITHRNPKKQPQNPILGNAHRPTFYTQTRK